MEHRWGTRTAVRVPVMLRHLSDGVQSGGVMVDLSISGARIETALELELYTGLEVHMGGRWLLAWVTRQGPGLIGVEWMALAPDAVTHELHARPAIAMESQVSRELCAA